MVIISLLGGNYIYLTPCVPLSYQGEGEEFCEGVGAPLRWLLPLSFEEAGRRLTLSADTPLFRVRFVLFLSYWGRGISYGLGR
jgi:hypothetical protein